MNHRNDPIALFTISFFLFFVTGSYCQVTTPAQWDQIRAARERNEARNREEQNIQTKAQNNQSNNSNNSPSPINKYSASDVYKENTFTYENVSKEKITLVRTFSVSDKYYPYVEIDAKYKPYGIYSGGKKVVHVYKTSGENKGNYERNHTIIYGQGLFEVFNALSKDGIYEGNWDGKKMYGTYKNKSGQVYTGSFDNLAIEGEGSLAEGGIIYKGKFTKGILQDVSSINYGGGIVYEGPTLAQARHGYGYITYPNGKIQYVGEWVDDRKNGEGAMILENGNHLIGVWVNDREEGDFNLYNPSYVLIKTIVYKAGIIVKQTTPKKTVTKPPATKTPVPTSNKIKPAEPVKKPVLTVEPKKELTVKPAEKIPEEPVITNFDKKYDYHEGRAVVKKNDKYGYIDESGKLVIPLLYEDAIEFEEGLAGIMLGKKYGFIDRAGKVIIPVVYEKTGFWFHEGLVGMQLNGKWGFINKENKVIAPFIYDDSRGFIEGLAAVQSNGKWGYIGTKGQIHIQLKYDDVFPFEEEVASVSVGKKWGYINLRGQEFIPVIYDAVYPVTKGIIKAKLNGKLFYFDTNGKPVNEQ